MPFYKDTAQNRRLDRVGKAYGKIAVKPRKPKQPLNYDPTADLERYYNEVKKQNAPEPDWRKMAEDEIKKGKKEILADIYKTYKEWTTGNKASQLIMMKAEMHSKPSEKLRSIIRAEEERKKDAEKAYKEGLNHRPYGRNSYYKGLLEATRDWINEKKMEYYERTGKMPTGFDDGFERYKERLEEERRISRHGRTSHYVDE